MVQIKIRKKNKDGHVRLESRGTIREVFINEDMLKPNQESISIHFSGSGTSGLIDFKPEELEKLYNTLRNRMHLIKGMKGMKNGP